MWLKAWKGDILLNKKIFFINTLLDILVILGLQSFLLVVCYSLSIFLPYYKRVFYLENIATIPLLVVFLYFNKKRLTEISFIFLVIYIVENTNFFKSFLGIFYLLIFLSVFLFFHIQEKKLNFLDAIIAVILVLLVWNFGVYINRNFVFY